MKAKKLAYALFENGYIHTRDLTKSEADEMLERYNRIFPQYEYYIMEIPYDFSA